MERQAMWLETPDGSLALNPAFTQYIASQNARLTAYLRDGCGGLSPGDQAVGTYQDGTQERGIVTIRGGALYFGGRDVTMVYGLTLAPA